MKICVIGAGVLGVTSAYALARRGHEVTVIERTAEPARECSYANGGQLSYSHAEPWANPGVFPKLFKWMWQDDAPLVLRFSTDPHMMRWGLLFLLNCLPSRARHHSEVMLRLGLYSRQKMAELVDETKVEFHHLAKGILHVFADQKAYDHARRQADFQQTLGGQEVALDRAGCFALEPALTDTTMQLIGGLHSPLDESGDIHFFTRNLADYSAQHHGVTFRFNTALRRIHQAHGQISHLELASGEYLSGFDAYVLAAGAYTPVYLRQLGMHVPIYPMKGYSISFNATDACPEVSVTDDGAKQVYTRLGGRMRVAGTAEFARYDSSVRKVRIDPLIAGVKKLFPNAPIEELAEWACLRPSTPDGPPTVGKTPLPNLYINSGHGTLGWTQAAGSARLLADVMDGTPTEIPLTGLTLERNLIRL